LSPASAILFEFRRRHRWGLAALVAYLVVLAAVKLVVVARGHAIVFDSDESFAFTVVVPLTATFTYLLALFTFGLSGDLAARQSMFPARMFTLPLSTTALAWWPMLYGTAAMVALWTASRLLVVWPSGFHIPYVWPAVLAAALLAWTQALTWMPYGIGGVRVVAAMVVLGTIDTVVLLALHFGARETTVIAIVAPVIPVAWLVARYAVGRARLGVVPDWRSAFAWAGSRRTASRLDFASADHAQAWFEWRRHGKTLPAMVAILLPFELLLLLAARNAPWLVVTILLGVFVTPPSMAAFVAATMRKSDSSARDPRNPYGLTPFIATRPITSPALVRAKLVMTVWSTLATWTLVLAAVPAGVALTGTWPTLVERFHRTVEVMGTARAMVFVALVVAAFMASTWRQLVQSQYVGLAGRDWIVKASVVGTLAFLSVLGPAIDWVLRTGSVRTVLWNAAPLILAALASAKVAAGAWVGLRLFESRLLRDRTLVIGAACWCATVLLVAAVLRWWFATDLVPAQLLVLLAILGVPLARVSVAPLAVAWNRHR